MLSHTCWLLDLAKRVSAVINFEPYCIVFGYFRLSHIDCVNFDRPLQFIDKLQLHFAEQPILQAELR